MRLSSSRPSDQPAAAFDRSLIDITWTAGGHLRCEECGQTRPLHARYWRTGWPKHCGYTMRWWTQRQLDAGEMPEIASEGP